MYIVGFLLGWFDTASEVGLLSISAATGASGMPIEKLIFSLAFTQVCFDRHSRWNSNAGHMVGIYKAIRKLYYNMNITFISVIIAFLLKHRSDAGYFSQLKLSGVFMSLLKLRFGNLDILLLEYLL